MSSNLGFKTLMLGQEQVDCCEIVANVSLGQDLFHFLDPVLLLGHVPVELPELPGFLEPGAPLNSQADELSICVFQGLDTLDNDGRIAGLVSICNVFFLLQELL